VERFRQWRENPSTLPSPLPVERAAAAAILEAAPEGYLGETEALAVLRAYGLPVPPFAFCRGEEEAAASAERLGYPAVLRLQSRQIVHKTEAKAVALDLPDAAAVRAAYRRMAEHVARTMPQARIDGAVVRRMVPAGLEVILGAKRDPSFGPVLMFGLGGIFVEVFCDVAFALAPIAPATADRMIRQVRSYALLEGERGMPRADLEGIRECLIRVGQLAGDFPRLAELDINPLIVGSTPGSCAVADVRIRLENPHD
jgi:acetyltransferase